MKKIAASIILLLFAAMSVGCASEAGDVFRGLASLLRASNSTILASFSAMNVPRKVALSLFKNANWGRSGLKKKMFIASLNPNKLLEALLLKK